MREFSRSSWSRWEIICIASRHVRDRWDWELRFWNDGVRRSHNIFILVE
jgi:hypothetical protein